MKATGYPDVDPWVVDWFEQNGAMMDLPRDGYSPEYLAAARPSTTVFPITVEIAKVTEDVVAGVPVWIYEHEGTPTGVIVYAHGGGFTTGSPGLMDPIARELAASSGAAIVSVEYRLAPENPFPAGLDDFEAVTRWVVDHAAERFGVESGQVAIAGESAGGNLSAALALKLRDTDGPTLAAQVLLYPALCGTTPRVHQPDVSRLGRGLRGRRSVVARAVRECGRAVMTAIDAQPGVLHVPAREIPVPTSVSEEAQRVLAMGPLAAAPAWPPLDDTAAWESMVAEADAQSAGIVGLLQRALIGDGSVPVPDVVDLDVDGVTVYSSTPADVAVDDTRIVLNIHGGAFVLAGERSAAR
jgi:acetyl esterase/lipase